MTTENFDDIRPYHDGEIPEVLKRLLHDDELIHAIARQRFGKIEPFISFIAHPIIRHSLKPQLKLLKDVKVIQNKVGRYIKRMLRQTSNGFTVSGLEDLDRSKSYLFIGNHRDITLDAALTNYALVKDNRNTCRLAIGDNLLSKQYVSDLMRLNKSFIVKRSATAPREMLTNFKNLSAYIYHSLTVDKSHVWIAQSEGRAKDGMDKTQPAVIKMISKARPSGVPFEEFIAELNIVPISISYELDPNDAAKAKELYVKEKHGTYRKSKYEDLDSITTGIRGKKGRIHLAFGNPLSGTFKNAKEVAKAIDAQVISSYQLHPTNYFAYQILYGNLPNSYEDFQSKYKAQELDQKANDFKARMDGIPEKHRNYALSIYANPVVQTLQKDNS